MWNVSAIWNAVSIGIAAAGLTLLAWALFADRPRGRLRCPRCWYVLNGTPMDDAGLRKCPECGRGSLHERTLRRTRRRWRFTLLAMLVLVVADQSRRIPGAHEHGWVALVPTTLIIPLAPIQSERWVRQTLGGADHLRRDRWAWLDELREALVERDVSRECWQWQSGAWAVLASWRPLGDERWCIRTVAIGSLLDVPEWTTAMNSPSPPNPARELLDVVTLDVEPDSWMDHGGDQGFAWLLGTRLVLVNSPECVEESVDLVGRLLRAATVKADADAGLVPLQPHRASSQLILDLRPLMDARGMDGPAARSLSSELSHQLRSRVDPDEWRENGGDGIWQQWVGTRLVVCGRTALVEQVRSHLHSCLMSALRKLQSDDSPPRDEPLLE